MIETHDLSREYGPKLALSGLNLRVEPGEIVGFLGPNGAGKSTTVKILTGMIRPTRGTARVAGTGSAVDRHDHRRPGRSVAEPSSVTRPPSGNRAISSSSPPSAAT